VKRPLALVVNAKSRRGQGLFESARARIDSLGFDIKIAEAVNDPKLLGTIITRLVDEGHELIAVGGGDGTLAAAAGLLAGKPVTMAILPLGTANSFARSLGIGPDLDAALAVLEAGHVEAVDVGEIAGVTFVGSATIGLPGHVARDIPDGLKRVLGRLGYAVYACGKFLQLKPFLVEVARPGWPTVRERVVEIRIGNGRFVGGVEAMPDADPTSRELLIQLVRGRYTASLAGVWAANIGGWSAPAGQVRQIEADAFEITCTPPQPVSVDGEAAATTPVNVRVLKGALKVMVPAGE
jgi:YegS/Rv2252/BmrU family lipid kinase